MYELGGPLEDSRVPGGTNLLVIGPPLTGKRWLGLDVLGHGVDLHEAAVVVTNTDGSDRIREWFGQQASPDAVGVVDCVSSHRGIDPPEGATIVGSPDDMTGAGIALSEHLEPYAASDQPDVRVLLSSISPLLIYSNVQTVFRFLHVCTSRIETAAGLGLYLIEEGVHEEGTIGTLKQLFDGVVRTDVQDQPSWDSRPRGTEQS